MIREYKHSEIDHIFIIKDISINEIEIDGVRIHKKDCDWMAMMSNHGGSKQTTTLKDLSLPILQQILRQNKI
jgi:hypothetical protein